MAKSGVAPARLPKEDANGVEILFCPELPLKVLASANKAPNMSSNGVELMPNEKEVYAGVFAPLHHRKGLSENMSRRTRACCAASCGCYLTLPKINKRMLIVVTDKRIIVKEQERKKNPGFASCWYYILCCWCKKNHTNVYKEMHQALPLEDIKAATMEIIEKEGRHGCLCCPRVRDHEQFTLRLDMTKNVGIFHPAEDWKWETSNKQAYYTDTLIGFPMNDMADAVELRRVLEKVVSSNLARDAAAANDTNRTLTNR